MALILNKSLIVQGALTFVSAMAVSEAAKETSMYMHTDLGYGRLQAKLIIAAVTVVLIMLALYLWDDYSNPSARGSFWNITAHPNPR